MSKCKYYRESKNETYQPECCEEDGGVHTDVHPADIEGEYCQMCGRKIKFKEFQKAPWAW